MELLRANGVGSFCKMPSTFAIQGKPYELAAPFTHHAAGNPSRCVQRLPRHALMRAKACPDCPPLDFRDISARLRLHKFCGCLGNQSLYFFLHPNGSFRQ